MGFETNENTCNSEVHLDLYAQGMRVVLIVEGLRHIFRIILLYITEFETQTCYKVTCSLYLSLSQKCVLLIDHFKKNQIRKAVA